MSDYNSVEKQDWHKLRTTNHISPVYDQAFGRYMLSIEEIVDNINKAGYPIDGWIVYVPDGNGGTKPLPDRLDDIIQNSPNLYRLEVKSTNGNVVHNPDFTSVLIPTLYKNNKDITENINAKYFKWTRYSGERESDKQSDAEWNLRWAQGAKEIPITKDDVRRNSSFNCMYVTEKEEVMWVMKAYQQYMILNNKMKEDK